MNTHRRTTFTCVIFQDLELSLAVSFSSLSGYINRGRGSAAWQINKSRCLRKERCSYIINFTWKYVQADQSKRIILREDKQDLRIHISVYTCKNIILMIDSRFSLVMSLSWLMRDYPLSSTHVLWFRWDWLSPFCDAARRTFPCVHIILAVVILYCILSCKLHLVVCVTLSQSSSLVL